MDKNMLATLSTTAISNNDQLVGVDYVPVLSISPAVLSFGVVSCGFYYNLKFQVKNHEIVPLRIKVIVAPYEDEKNTIRVVNLPDVIAPGMESQITLELAAEFPGISMFSLKITQNYDTSVYSKYVEANIVTQETFKYVKKSLELQKRPIHRHNVITLSSIQGYSESASINTPATSFSEALIMDDEDLDDLLSYPKASNVYWDPFEKCLRIDPPLGSVLVDKDFSLEESIAKTEALRRQRNQDLEEQGFLTAGAFERIINDRLYGSRPGSVQKPTQEIDLDGIESRTLELEDGLGSHASSHSRLLSVSSLLAMKRDRIEKQRRDTVNSSTEFVKNSKKDSMVNSMRTLSMIQSRQGGSGGGSVKGGGSLSGSSVGSKEREEA